MYKLSFSGKLPSVAEWLLILGFIIGALGLASQTFVLTTQESAVILFVIGVLTLLAKMLTNEVTPVMTKDC
jgi:hypothetical protein